MNKTFRHVSLSVFVVLAAGQIARAQYGGMGGGGMGGMGMGGMGGGYGGGSSLPLSTGMGQQSSYGAFGNRTLGGGFNPTQSGFGGGAGGTAGGGAPSGLGLQNQQAAGQITGNERFLRQNQQPGNFIGSDSGEARNFIGAMSGLLGNRNGMGNQQFGNNRGRNNQNQNRNNRNNRAERVPFKLSYVADFAPSQAAITPAAAAKLGQQLSKSKRLTASGPIQVELQGQTVILRGVVGSNHERDLAAQMAMLEPGVANIQNDLQVGPPRAPASRMPVPELPAPANLRSPR
jgi:hypothetical protein